MRLRSLILLVAASGCATTFDAKWRERPSAVVTADVAAEITEGDAAWSQRGDQAQLTLAIARWKAAFDRAPSAELAAKLARAEYFLGDGFLALQHNDVERDAAYQRGLEWATTSLKLAAPAFADAMAEGKSHADAVGLVGKDAVPALYWYASNLGKWAATKGFATRRRTKDDLQATMERVKELDEAYFYAAPWRFFGGLEAASAGLAGGSLEKSEQDFKKALELAPDYLGTRVLWAEFLCTKANDRAAYEKLLREVLAADPAADPAIEPENRREQKKAERLLAEIAEKF